MQIVIGVNKMNYTITPANVDMRRVLHVCGAPDGLKSGPIVSQPFFWGIGKIEFMLSRSIASNGFLRGGKRNGGVMLASYDQPMHCQKAFELLTRDMGLADFDQSRAVAGEFAIARNKERPYCFGARTPNVVLLVHVPFLSNDAAIEDYSNRLMDDLYSFSLDPSLLDEWMAGSEGVEPSEEEDWTENMIHGISDAVQPHLATLSTKFRQKIMRDDYGNEDYSASINEIDYFAKNVIANQFNFDEGTIPLIRAALVRMALAFEKGNASRPINVDVESLDPFAFEQYCADSLTRCGWTARATKKSGDQGIDVLATRGGIKAVLQCKKLSSPVGNGAVQEAISGKAFEQADVACVVTNNTFTQAAKQLAAMSGVLLLHYRDLPQLSDRIGLAEGV